MSRGQREGDKEIASLEKFPRLCLSGVETAWEWVQESVYRCMNECVCISITFMAGSATTYPIISSLRTSPIDAT